MGPGMFFRRALMVQLVWLPQSYRECIAGAEDCVQAGACE